MKDKENRDFLKPIVALCKRRGFVYPGSEIYGGFANTYSYGPYGTEMKRNIKNLWWKIFVQEKKNVFGMDGPIFLHPKVWNASGHLEGFNDAMIDCKECKSRFRADHLIKEVLNQDADGKSLEEMTHLIRDNDVDCPKCRSKNFTDVRNINLMFQTLMSKTSASHEAHTYLRPETAQAIFLEFKNIINTMRAQIPFGIAQIGKAFRNEITPGNFIFRVIEFEQMEIEFFIHKANWKNSFTEWLFLMKEWCNNIGLSPEKLSIKEHGEEQLSHYSKRTVDIIYDFPFGPSELYGLAYRTDYDLKSHMECTGQNLEYRDLEKKEAFLPHVIEPTFGVDRTVLALLCNAYEEEKLSSGEMRTVLHLSPKIAPVKVAVFPLMKKPPLRDKAWKVFKLIQTHVNAEYDETGAIGKRYRRQDELGTPLCITIDYETIEDDTITIRDRDSMYQVRTPISNLITVLPQKLSD